MHSKNAFSDAIYFYLHEPSILHSPSEVFHASSPDCSVACLEQEPLQGLLIRLLNDPLKLQISHAGDIILEFV